MNGLLLKSEQQLNNTMVPNLFIDIYMGRANGEFVKVYLYLLRCVVQPPDNLSLGLIADSLYMTEGDIMRALHYWEREGLLHLEKGADNALTALTLGEPSSLGNTHTRQSETPTAKQPQPANKASLHTHDKNKAPRGISKEDAALQDVNLIAEQYLGRPLTTVDVDKIAFFYKELHFSPDLIEYLFDHCVTIGNRSMRYIESVAIAWRDKHITTVEQAKTEGAHYKREYFQILKAFGINSRTPIDNEVQYMRRWLEDYHFTVDVISEACQRTIAKTGNVSFPYAESILKNWKEHGILAKRDIAALDEAHYARKQAQKEAAASQQKVAHASSKFNNFEQRSYDFDELERLLNDVPT